MGAHAKPLSAEHRAAEDLDSAIESRWSEAQEILHMLDYLTRDLEDALRTSRAIERKDGIVTLAFTESSIDATIWLASKAWSEANKLTKELSVMAGHND
ncbi:hypothetical protein [Oricola sp.]|uniref:hypothetical protein n=1 Tax=Oricola sp. TaxID=1979950 RepID=UPI0035189814